MSIWVIRLLNAARSIDQFKIFSKYENVILPMKNIKSRARSDEASQTATPAGQRCY